MIDNIFLMQAERTVNAKSISPNIYIIKQLLKSFIVNYQVRIEFYGR